MSPTRPARGRRRRARGDGDGEIPAALRRAGLRPRAALGQNFLVDELALGRIAEAARVGPGDTVLEVGAGPGGLTAELVARVEPGGRVVAVELDEELADLARRRVPSPRLEVLAANVLDFEAEELLAEAGAGPPYVAVGNLPYYITQPVLRRLLDAAEPPRRIVVLVQRELARRIVGGDRRESLLSLVTRLYGAAEVVLELPPSAFWPRPRVHSALIRVERWAAPPLQLEPAEREALTALLRAGFSQPRKQLHNVLPPALGLPADRLRALLAEAEVEPSLRAQHLTLPDWERLLRLVLARHPRALGAG
ncbi:MAG: 16S rRNA (adenine(1518)-N(6)/adenine(1519)-N(6))-dimethyltransferase RsmA [Chloroflexi bacterium]|nr:16S rRNA (adenine(1518)-N(6)/adenine(1519)-N(6))-dimethyltransferase RsmA [Chloroflexota bacterium]